MMFQLTLIVHFNQESHVNNYMQYQAVLIIFFYRLILLCCILHVALQNWTFE